MLRAAASLLSSSPGLATRLVVVFVGGPSGSEVGAPGRLDGLAASLGISAVVRQEPPCPQRELADWYRAATIVLVPSHSESFGLVALEAQACGTPVVAAAVGGLRTAVRDGFSGILVDGHDPGLLCSRGGKTGDGARAADGALGWRGGACLRVRLAGDGGAADRRVHRGYERGRRDGAGVSVSAGSGGGRASGGSGAAAASSARRAVVLRGGRRRGGRRAKRRLSTSGCRSRTPGPAPTWSSWRASTSWSP